MNNIGTAGLFFSALTLLIQADAIRTPGGSRCLPPIILHQGGTYEDTTEFWDSFLSDLNSEHCHQLKDIAYRLCSSHYSYGKPYKRVADYLANSCWKKKNVSSSEELRKLVLQYCHYGSYFEILAAYTCTTRCLFADHLNQLCYDREHKPKISSSYTPPSATTTPPTSTSTPTTSTNTPPTSTTTSPTPTTTPLTATTTPSTATTTPPTATTTPPTASTTSPTSTTTSPTATTTPSTATTTPPTATTTPPTASTTSPTATATLPTATTTPPTATTTPPTATTPPTPITRTTTTELVCGDDDCGQVFQFQNETVRSSGYPCPYPRNATTRCIFFVVNRGRNITLTPLRYDRNCVDDVEIKTGNLQTIASSKPTCELPVGQTIYIPDDMAVVIHTIKHEFPAPRGAYEFEIDLNDN